MLGDESADSRTATVIVPDDQLSLAIGKEGQNARLAAKLTGWRIDIKNQKEAATEDLRAGRQVATAPAHERDILAMAEAILLGKETAPSLRTAEPEQEQEVAQAEQEPAEALLAESPEEPEDERSILTVADALLHEQKAAPVSEEEALAQGPVLALEEQAEPEAELQASEETLLEEETALEPELSSAQELELELPAVEEAEPEPSVAGEPQPAPAPEKAARRTRYEFVEDESLEVLTTPQKKGDRRRQRRDLVLDEQTGQVISRRRHKRGGTADEVEWEDNEY
jgi:N utilization substance protein A